MSFRTARGNATAKRREDSVYGKEYCEKMRATVKAALANKMRNKKFRAAWLEKARAASKTGTAALKQKFASPRFRAAWRKKCRLGGAAAHRMARPTY